MDDSNALRDVTIRSARDRCQAHLRYLERFRTCTQPSPVIQDVLKALESALTKLDKDLDALATNELMKFLDRDQIEATIHFKSKYLQRISSILSLIENADITAMPGELTAPLRRETKRLFPDAEVIMVANPELNYTIVELAIHLRALLTELGHEEPEFLPKKVFRISIPKVEYDQALLHCILAHELGHPLYRELDLEAKILPIEVDESKIKSLYKRLKATWERQPPNGNQTELFSELFFINVVTKEVINIIPNWVQEIAADLLGLLIFGPAFILALIHFSSSVFLLNSASQSHPPLRFRLKILFSFMGGVFPLEQLPTKTREVLESWQVIAGQDISDLQPFEQIAYDTIQDESVSRRITKAVSQSLPDDKRFSADSYSKEVIKHIQRINAMIPPVEFLIGKEHTLSTVPGILNAGWECYLQGLEEFKSCLSNPKDFTEFEVKLKFNRFLMKSMEQNQIAHEWGKTRDAIVRGDN